MNELDSWYDKYNKLVDEINVMSKEYTKNSLGKPEIVITVFEFYDQFIPIYFKFKDSENVQKRYLAEGIRKGVQYVLAQHCEEIGSCEALYYETWNLLWQAGKVKGRFD